MKKEVIQLQKLPVQIYNSGLSDSETGIVFIHGNALSGMYFKHQLECELKNAAQLVTFDLPGCGNTHYDKTRHSYKFIVDLIGEVANYFKFKKLILVGHSLGGHMAIAATQYLSNINGLFVFGTPPLRKLSETEIAFKPGHILKFYNEILSDEEIAEITGSICQKQENIDFTIELIRNSSGKARAQLFSSFPESFRNEVELIDQIKRYPVFIGHSNNDLVVNANYLKGINFSNLWRNSLHYFQCRSHSPNLDCPEEFNMILSEYCNDVLGES